MKNTLVLELSALAIEDQRVEILSMGTVIFQKVPC